MRDIWVRAQRETVHEKNIFAGSIEDTRGNAISCTVAASAMTIQGTYIYLRIMVSMGYVRSCEQTRCLLYVGAGVPKQVSVYLYSV